MHFTLATASIAAFASVFSGAAAQVAGCEKNGPSFTVSNFQLVHLDHHDISNF